MHTTISVPYDNGNVAKNFEKATEFKTYIVQEDGTISDSEVFPFKGRSAASHAIDLGGKITNMLICDQIKSNSRLATAEANIRLIIGQSGNADEVVVQQIAEGHHINVNMWGKATHMDGLSILREQQKKIDADKAAKKAAREAAGENPTGLRKFFGKKK